VSTACAGRRKLDLGSRRHLRRRIIEHDLEVERIIFMGLLRSATPEKLVGRFDRMEPVRSGFTRRFCPSSA